MRKSCTWLNDLVSFERCDDFNQHILYHLMDRTSKKIRESDNEIERADTGETAESPPSDHGTSNSPTKEYYESSHF